MSCVSGGRGCKFCNSAQPYFRVCAIAYSAMEALESSRALVRSQHHTARARTLALEAAQRKSKMYERRRDHSCNFPPASFNPLAHAFCSHRTVLRPATCCRVRLDDDNDNDDYDEARVENNIAGSWPSELPVAATPIALVAQPGAATAVRANPNLRQPSADVTAPRNRRWLLHVLVA